MSKQKKKSSKVGTIISYTLTILLIALLAYVVIVRMQGGTPSIGGYTILRIASGSMEGEREDSIATGSYILVHKTTADKIEVDDVITFYSIDPKIEGYLNTHRVVEIEQDENGSPVFITRGDANYKNDDYKVDTDHLFGEYVTTLKLITKVANFFLKKTMLFGMIILYASIAVVTVIGVVQIVKKKEDPSEDKKQNESEDDSNDKQP